MSNAWVIFMSVLPLGLVAVFEVMGKPVSAVVIATFAAFILCTTDMFATRAAIWATLAFFLVIGTFDLGPGFVTTEPNAMLFAITPTVVLAIFFAVTAAFYAEKSLSQKISMTFLVFHNLLWTATIGSTMYFGLPSGVFLLLVAIACPLNLLAYKTTVGRWKRNSRN